MCAKDDRTAGWRKSQTVLLTVALAAMVMPAWAETAGTRLDSTEIAGHAIYHQGRAGDGPPITARIGAGAIELSGEQFPCANCHGDEGEPQREGTLDMPGIAWNRLTTPSQRLSVTRPAYDEPLLARAVQEGIGSSGKPLAEVMPRYRMSPAQMKALIAYLKQLGSEFDLDPSIDPASVRLGSILPLSGSEASTGQLVKRTLEACLATVNSEGGIYGRHLELDATDAAANTDGTRNPSLPVLAYLANYRADRDAAANAVLPVIAPLTFEPDGTRTTGKIFHVLPTLASQARAALDYLASSARSSRPKLAIVHSGHQAEIAVANAIVQQARHHGWAQPLQLRMDSRQSHSRTLAKTLILKRIDTVFYLGSAGSLAQMAERLRNAQHSPTLVALIAMTGRAAFSLPREVAARTLLATPIAVNDQEGTQRLAQRLANAQVELVNPGLQAAACGAVDLFADAAKQAGRRLSPRKLADALEQLRDVRLPLLPELDYSPGHHFASSGAFIVGLAPDRKGFVKISDWITPEAD